MMEETVQGVTMRVQSLMLAGVVGLMLMGSAGVSLGQGQASMTLEARKAAHIPYTQPVMGRNIYPPITAAEGDLKKALAEARRTHKRIILDFGGDWCGDCQVLDVYFHQAPNDKLLNDNFIKVNVNIGREDANVDLAHRYGVPLDGVPALAVLDSNGKTLYSQSTEFSDMRYMAPESVTEFLKKWKKS